MARAAAARPCHRRGGVAQGWCATLTPVCQAAWLALTLAVAPAGWALPQGATPTLGQVVVAPGAPATLEIVQTSARAGLDWRSFSIAAGERLLVRQPDAASVLFNRVTGADPSLILGQLQANGRVFLSNPRGIIFGAGSQVDVGSLVATTLDINTSPLANGRYQLSGGTAGTGALRADGRIRASSGTVVLVAPSLSVGGNLLAGRLGLAAAGTVQVDVDGDGLVFFNARSDDLAARLRVLPGAELLGRSAELRAAARSGFADTVLNLEGVVRATGLAQRDGQVVIDGGSAGITRVAGTVLAQRDAVGAAGLFGGDVTVLGDRLLIADGARLDASGTGAGGRLRLGGDFQGGRADGLHPASQVVVQAGATLGADATGRGPGGQVVVWSEQATRFAGSASARGGAAGGDGGLVEVSSRGWLDFSGRVDLGAGAGRAGLLLLDPENIEIVASGPNLDGSTGGTADLASQNLLFTDFPGKNSTLTAGRLATQIGLGDVVLEASNRILVSSAVSSPTTAAVATSGALTLRANSTVELAAGVSINGSGKGLTLAAPSILVNDVDLAAASITLTGAASWTVAGSRSVGATVGGSGSIDKLGPGTLTLSGNNSYAGATRVGAGVLRATHGSALGGTTAGTTVASGAALELSGGITLAEPLSLAGSGVAGAGALRSVSGANQLTGPITLTGAARINTDADALTLDVAAGQAITATDLGLTLGGAGSTVLNDAIALGSGSLAKDGNGTLTLAAASTYSGVLTLSAGTLATSAADRLGSSTALTLAAGSTLVLGGSQTLASLNGAGNLSLAGTLTLGADGSDSQLGGAVSGIGGLRKLGAGTLTLSGSNTVEGATRVSGGRLQLDHADALPNSTLTLDNTAGVSLLLLRDAAVGALAGGGDSGGAATLGSFTLTTGGNDGNTDYAGAINGSGGLVKAGVGTFSLSGASPFAGTTLVSGGTLRLNHAGALASSALDLAGTPGVALTLATSSRIGSLAGGSGAGGSVTLDGFTLSLGGDGRSGRFDGAVNGLGSLVKQGAGQWTLGGIGSFAGSVVIEQGTLALASAGLLANSAVTLANAAGAALALQTGASVGALAGGGSQGGQLVLGSHLLSVGASNADTDFAGAISGSGGLLKQGGGRLTLSGSGADFSGSTTVMAGQLRLNQADVLAGSAVSLANLAGVGLQLATSSSIGSLADGGTTGGQVALGGFTLRTGGNGRDTTFAGAIGGGGVLVKQGGGTLTLAGANSHAGGTEVNGGMLAIDDDARLGLASGRLTLAGGTLRAEASLAIARPITLGTGGGTFDSQGHTLTIASAIGGSGGLSKAGTGTLALAAANQYTGATTLANGTLSLDHAQALPTGTALVLADQAGVTLALLGDTTVGSLAGGGRNGGSLLLGSHTLSVGGNHGSTDFGGAISGSGGLVKLGSGDFRLSGSNSFSGGTRVQAGTLTLQGGAALADGATLTLADQAGAGLVLLSNETLGALAGGGPLGGHVALGSATLSVGGNGADSRFDGVVSGLGSLVKQGGGVLTLGGANTLTGGTRVDAGTLALDHPQVLAASRVTLAAAAGVQLLLLSDATLGALAGGGAGGGDIGLGSFTLSVGARGDDTQYAGAIAGTGRLVKQGSGALALAGSSSFSGGVSVQAGTLTLQGGNALDDSLLVQLAAGATLALGQAETIGALAGSGAVALNGHTLSTGGRGGDSTYSGAIGGSGSLVKQGGGRLTLAGANTFSGGTTVLAGTLVLAGGTALAGTGTVTLADAAGVTLQLAADQAIGALAGGGAAGGGVALGGFTLRTGGSGQSTRFGGVIGGHGGLVKQGGGLFTLAGANTYSGSTTVQAGTLVLGTPAALAAGSVVTLADAGATLQLAADQTLGALAGGGAVQLDGFTLRTGSIGGDSRYSGVIAGSGGLVKQGGGVFTLAGANTFSGGTTVQAGTLALAGGAALPATGVVTLADAAGVTLQLAADQTVGALAGGGLAGGTVQLNSFALSVGGSGADSRFDGAIAGSGGLVKQGGGVFTLAGANTFSGGTTVQAGTLVLAGGAALADGGAVTLANAAGVRLQLQADETVGALAGGGAAGGELQLGGHTLSVGGRAGSSRFDGVISGDGGLVKQGPGHFTLGGSNTYTGATAITGGVLAVAADAQLGRVPALATAGQLVLDGGTLQVDDSFTLAPQRGVALQGAGGHVDITSGKTLTLPGELADGTSAGALVKLGAGTLALANPADNRYTGATQVLGGVLAIHRDGQLGPAPATVAAQQLLLDGGALQVQADLRLATTRGLWLGDGGGTLAVDGGATLALGGPVASGAAVAAPGTLAGSLSKAGAGQLTLDGADNQHAGATRVLGGVLAFSRDGQLGLAPALARPGHLLLDGGTLQVLANGELQANRGLALGSAGGRLVVGDGLSLRYAGTIADAGAGAGTLVKAGGGQLSLAASPGSSYRGATQVLGGVLAIGQDAQLGSAPAVATAGQLVLDGGTLLAEASLQLASQRGLLLGASGGTVAVATGQTLRYGGVITDGAGASGLRKTGAGQFTLDGPAANTYRGATQVLDGVLAILRDEQLGAPPAQTTPGHLLLDGGSLQVGGSTTLAPSRGLALGAGGGTLVVDTTATLAYDGVIADDAALAGAAAGGLSKAGAGRLVLGGANRYLGGTRVLAGTLATAAGDQHLPDAGTLLLADGATLALGGNERVAALGDLPAGLVDSQARVELGRFTLTIDAAAGQPDVVFGGILSADAGGRLVKLGDGLLQLGGTGQGQGLVEVNQGTLVSVGAGSLSPQATVRVAANATLRLAEPVTVQSFSLSGVLDGVGRLTATADATLAGGTLNAALSTVAFSSQGLSTVNAPVRATTATVQGGTLTLGAAGSLGAGRLRLQGGGGLVTQGAGQLLPGADLQVAAGSTLALAGAESVASLTLAGTLASTVGGAGGAGGASALAVAGTAALQGGALVDVALSSLRLTSQGSTLVQAALRAQDQAVLVDGSLTLAANATLDTPQLMLQQGQLVTSAAQALSSGMALQVAAPATLVLGGDAQLRSLQLQGSVRGVPAGTPLLTLTDWAQLDGASVLTPLSTPLLSSQGRSSLAAAVTASTGTTVLGGELSITETGRLDTPLLQLQAGSLLTASAQQLAADSVLQMAPGSRLQLGGDQVLASLADLAPAGAGAGLAAAQLLIGSHQLAVGHAGTDTRFSGRIAGTGSLVKQGTGQLLLSADQGYGDTRIEAGTLQIGDGGRAGSLGSGAVRNDGTLRLALAEDRTLTLAVSGSGALEQAGSATLTLAGSGLAYTGATVASSGTLRTAAAEVLPDASRVVVGATGRLVLGGAETVLSIHADGPVSLGGSVASSGDQRYGGAVTLTGAQPILLSAPGQTIEALHDGNRWGGQPLSVQAGRLRLSAGRADGTADYRDLVLGEVRLAGQLPALAAGDDGSSQIDTGRLSIGVAGQAASGVAALDGLLQLDGGGLALRAHAAPVYARPTVAAGEGPPTDPLKGREILLAGELISQGAHSQVVTVAGSSLLLQSTAGGSISLGQVRNRLAGGVSALSGSDWRGAWVPVALPGGREVGQSRITLAGQRLQIGGPGLEADLVRLSAGQLATDAGSVVRARLWYNDAGFGVEKSTPGLQLTLLPEAYGLDRSFGRGDQPINVDVGSRSIGNPRDGLSAGFVQVLPRLGARGSTAVFLAGPKVGLDGYAFFHDGAGDALELPVFYNGVLPATPQLAGSLSAVASVSETARRERFEEAVRTENVAIRLRAGVIAEVGPGRSATQGSQGLRLPATCRADEGQLGCAAAPVAE